MPPASLRHAAVPSPALLRFLRAQSILSRTTPATTFPPPRCAYLSHPRHDSSLATTNIRLPPARPLQTSSACQSTSTRGFHTSLSRPSAASCPIILSSAEPLALLPKQAEYLVPRRAFSNTPPADFFWKKQKRKSGAGPLQPNDLPPRHPEGYAPDDHGNLGRVLRPINEPRIRCTEFDDSGKITLVNSEFRKSELIAKYGLLPRDLRKIDSSTLPHILVRPTAILLNLLHLRVLIKHNRVLVFDAYGTTNSYAQSLFMYDLEGRLRQKDLRQNGSLPYEFRALEAVLLSVTTGLESEFEGVREPVVRVLRELEEDIDRDKLRYLLVYSKKLGSFEQQARLVRDALEELLEADDDLASMYLTEKITGQERGEHDHAEVELLLESYHKIADEIVQAAENLVSNIRNTEEIVKAILDANRNSLMLLDLKFSVWTVGLAAGTFVAALYGMNLKNFIEESDLGFWGVSAWCAIATLLTSYLGLGRLRRVQRVSMWGEHGARRSSWRELGPQALLSSGSSSPKTPSPPRVPPVGAAAAGVAPSSTASTTSTAFVSAGRAEKLKQLKEMHAQQALGVNVEIQAARRSALHGRHGLAGQHGNDNGHGQPGGNGEQQPPPSST
ncbi:Mitochondrial inner membrane magnesium transporter mrs2 [Diplodia seriata]|uniref:Magnesium transporter n=1 Tax=Diplodia seriata TaxID=420778 RepID=A0A1S8BBR3_9PEZI|nr:Mitochondrial inner membrane magnesium transporter mrs2 [Diplodia seriata]